jgi:hypothetical protein
MSGFVDSLNELINNGNIFFSNFVSISSVNENKNDDKLKNLRNCIKQIITERKKNIYPTLYVCYQKSYLFILSYNNKYYVINKEHDFNIIFTKYIMSYFHDDIDIFCKNKLLCKCIFHHKKNVVSRVNNRWNFELDQTIKTPLYTFNESKIDIKKEINQNIWDSYKQLKKNVLSSKKYSIPVCDISCECPCCYHMLSYEVDTFYLPPFDLEVYHTDNEKVNTEKFDTDNEKEDNEKEDNILEKISCLPIEMSEYILSYYKYYYPHKASLLNRDFLNTIRFRKSPSLSYYGVYGVFTQEDIVLSTNSIIIMKLKKDTNGSFISYFEHIYNYHYKRQNTDIIKKLELYLSRFLQWIHYEHRRKYITTEAFRLKINFTRKRTFYSENSEIASIKKQRTQ